MYNLADCPTPFEKSPWVNYQGDMYVGDDGARYEVMELPHMVDATGLLHPHTSDEADIFLRRGMGPEPQTTSMGSKGPGTSANPFDVREGKSQNKPREEPEVTTGFTFETGHWMFVKETPVWRIF